jgi:glycosyltransferase involved in cell wall biosynthesis
MEMFKPVRTLSVVIPCLNEATNISSAYKSVKDEKGLLEVIIADGGSIDDTREIGAGLGARIVESAKGRGLQINAGIKECAGDVILVLHADCKIVPGTTERILHLLNNNPDYIGGALGISYGTNPLKYRVPSMISNARALYSKISFGDQGQFFRKEILDIVGGFPRQMLMEDVEFSIHLKKKGKVAFIPKGIIASTRRLQDKGIIKNFIQVSALFMTYLIKRRYNTGDPLRIEFYNRYYKNNKISY